MERKTRLVPDCCVTRVRAVYHDFRPDPPLRPCYGDSRGRFSIITSHGKPRIQMIPSARDIHKSPLNKLLGREYYQTSFGEKYLVLAPLVVHPLASVAKRLFSLGIGSQKPLSQPRPMTSILSSTGYLTLFLFLPVHYLTHRIYPTIPDAPIHSFGPGELDYEFVKTGLQTWPSRSWFLYIGLVGCVALHSVEGISIITKTQFGRAFVSKKGRRLVSLLVGIPAIAGLYFISRETVWALAPSVESYVIAFSKSAIYRIL